MKPVDLIDRWRAKHFPPVKRDEEWHRFKWHVCKAGEPTNPISVASGGEIQVEQFGIIGWLYRIETDKKPKVDGKIINVFYQCPLIESREQGTGKFGEWLESVKAFCRDELKAPFALATITNQGLYKYCERHGVFVAQDGMLYSVKTKKS